MPTKPCAAFIGLAVLSIAAQSAANEYPYDAYVVVEQADVVAGPGHRFYVTDRLQWGTKVEIYREEASGWLAIRPPESAFSWVPAEFIERLDDDNLGRVTEPAGAWIGTSVEHVSQHHQHITLKSGELVQILGEKAVATAGGAERTWLKIAPPAGEYRWVYLRDVSRQPPETRPAANLAAATPNEIEEVVEERAEPQRFELAGQPIALSNIDQPTMRGDKRVVPAQFRTTESTANQPNIVSSDGFVPRKRRDAVGIPPAAISTSPPPATRRIQEPISTRPSVTARTTPVKLLASSSSADVKPAPTGLSAAEVNRQLDQLEIDLSLMIAQDRSQWNLDAIKRSVTSLVETGGDAVSRGRARLMLDKIKQFEATFHDPANSTASNPSGNAISTTSAPTNKSLADPRYDAQGILKEVISRKSANPAAPYAVVDAEGKPLCFVSPSPGLNLNRYLNKPVGLYGRRGYLEELRKPHVVAENVIELDARWR